MGASVPSPRSHRPVGFLRLCFLLVAVLMAVFPLNATVAAPWLVEQTQPDGSRIKVRIYGDEYFHYRTDEQGYLLSRRPDGYYHYMRYDAKGKPFWSEKAAGRAHPMMRATELPQAVRHGAQERRAAARSKLETPSPVARLRSAEAESPQLVILVEFSDRSFSVSDPATSIDRMLNERGYGLNGATGSARDYYKDNSGGLFNPHFVVMGPYKLQHPTKYYGENDQSDNDIRPEELMVEAAQAAYEDGMNPGDFDSDGDGVLDRFFVYFAGYSEAEGGKEDYLWPHASTLYYSNHFLGAYRLGKYACTQELRGYSGREMAGIGTFCHEFSHTLGLPDFYDVDYEESGGDSDPLGTISLMSSGNYLNNGRTPPCLNAEELDILGWLHPSSLPMGDVSLSALPGQNVYRYDTEVEGEYFLFENRQKVGWDLYLPSHGLLIYHVDRSENIVYKNYTAAQMWRLGNINVYPGHPCMTLVKKTQDVKTAFFPSVSSEWNRDSKPSSALWSGVPADIQLNGITESGGLVRFTVRPFESDDVYLSGRVTDKTGAPVADAELYLTLSSASAQNSAAWLSEPFPAKTKSGMKAFHIGPFPLFRSAMATTQTLTARTGSDGQYIFGGSLTPGQYVLLCQKDGYSPVTKQLELVSGSYFRNLTLLPWADRNFLKTLSWCEAMVLICGWTDVDFSVAAKWTADDLAPVWQLLDDGEAYISIGEVGVYIYIGTPRVTARIMADNTELARQAIPASEVTNDDYTLFDFTDTSVRLKRGQSLQVIFDLEDVKGDCYVALDEGPHVPDKGDLVCLHQKWSTIYEMSDKQFDGNWDIKVDLLRPRASVPINSMELQTSQLQMRAGEEQMLIVLSDPQVSNDNFDWSSSDKAVATVNALGNVTAVGPGSAVITVSANNGSLRRQCRVDVIATLGSTVKTQVSQHKFYARWDKADAAYWKISFKPFSSLKWSSAEIESPEFVLKDLAPRTTYEYKIEAYSASRQLQDSYSGQFTTVSSSNLPMSIFHSDADYAEDGYILLDVNDMPDGSSLTWTLDDKEYEADILRYTGSSHKLKACVVLPSGKGTEYIMRMVK